MDMWGAIFWIEVARLFLPKHRVFVGCEMDEECLGNAKKPILRHAPMFLSKSTSDLTVDPSVLEFTWILNNSTSSKAVEDRCF